MTNDGRNGGNFLEELTRLADLRDRGVLTEQEFAEEKARLQAPRNSHSSKPDHRHPSSKAATTDTVARTEGIPKGGTARKFSMGCLIALGVLFSIMLLGAILGSKQDLGSNGQSQVATVNQQSAAGADNSTLQESSPTPEVDKSDNLTLTQRNAARSAQQYLNMSGFSRAGLIAQLSSSAGDGYSVEDATAAVDSISVDWNENAAMSAKQYLQMSGFSCSGLVQQLSSSAGDKYTKAQATYGAQQAGAC